MEDKTYDFMEKLYNEFSNFKTEMNNKLDNLQTGQQKLENVVTRLENKVDSNSKTLFDGYSQSYEKLEILEKKVDEISSKIDKQEVEIKVIKGGKG